MTNPVCRNLVPTCNDILPISDGKLFSIKKEINLAQKLTFSKTEPTFAVISRTGTVCSPIFICHWTYFVFYGIFMPSRSRALYPFPFCASGACGIGKYLPWGRIRRVYRKSRRSLILNSLKWIRFHLNVISLLLELDACNKKNEEKNAPLYEGKTWKDRLFRSSRRKFGNSRTRSAREKISIERLIGFASCLNFVLLPCVRSQSMIWEGKKLHTIL